MFAHLASLAALTERTPLAPLADLAAEEAPPPTMMISTQEAMTSKKSKQLK